MDRIPRDPAWDGLPGLLKDGYRFGSERFTRLKTDIFRTRLLFHPVICVRGEDAARMIYAEHAFTRRAALPPTALMLLQDYRSVNRLDGAAHHHRKAMFMSLMSESGIHGLCELTQHAWVARFERKPRDEDIVFHEEVVMVLCRAAVEWVGADVADSRVQELARELLAMIEGAGSFGWKTGKGLVLRHRTEKWARGLIRAARSGTALRTDPTPLEVLALHRDENGGFLPTKTAAVELINLLRPVVAVGRYITFAALALHEHPEARRRIADGDEIYIRNFVQEVRRYYPFFPMVAGRAMESFQWKDCTISEGDLVMLDLYGTNHDPNLWVAPDEFNPDRFNSWDGSRFNFIPQGAGSYHTGHRCPGEEITISLIRMAVKRLAISMTYEVPPQNLEISLNRFPTLPASGLVLRNVRGK